MVNFGKRILLEQNPEWRSFYVDYKSLKKLIKEIVLTTSTSDDASSIRIRAESFMKSLDFEIGKAAAFYHGLIEEIVQALVCVRTQWQYLTVDTLPYVYTRCKKICSMIGECMSFLELNVEATRKILKKAEKLMQSEVISKEDELILRLRPDNLSSRLDMLRVYSETDHLIAEVYERLNYMRDLEAEWLADGMIDKKYVSELHKRRNTEELVQGMLLSRKKTLHQTSWFYGLLSQAQIDYETEPVGDATPFGLFLNNFNTFLYMTNYYIVIPTANQYAVHVGMSNSSSGLLLAMTPLASLLASILYSSWSNRGFKAPLIFSTFLLIFGNLLYVMAYSYVSPVMLFTGRILIGLGGNRAVNRRYIADFVPIKARTFHSAIFVAVGSLGMSVGPGSQAILEGIDYTIPGLQWEINKLTASGWLLLVLWLIFLVLTAICFHDPERRYAKPSWQTLFEPLLTDAPDTLAIDSKAANSATDKSTARDMKILCRSSEKSGNNSTTNWTGTIICLVVYLVLKLVQETYQSASPLVTEYWFGWTEKEVSILLAIIGLVVVPANLSVGFISNKVSDRVSQIVSVTIIIMGCVISFSPPSYEYNVYQYTMSIAFIFIAAQVLESVNMGLLSKLMPKTFSKGLWNSGFLSTESGTLGRACGNLLVFLAGIAGQRYLQMSLAVTCFILLLVILFLCLFKWGTLIPAAEFMRKRNVDKPCDGPLSSIILGEAAVLHPVPSILNTQRSSYLRASTVGAESCV